jgi:hypothetical protein
MTQIGIDHAEEFSEFRASGVNIKLSEKRDCLTKGLVNMFLAQKSSNFLVNLGRMWGIAILMALLSMTLGCGVEQDANDESGQDVQFETQAASGDDEPTSAGSPNEAVTQASGCSVVEFCDAPGSDGARCKQLGCSFNAAFEECVAETPRVCGTPKCPWRFVPLSGASFDICLF